MPGAQAVRTRGEAAAPLFDGWEKVMLRACLEGTQGRVYTCGETPPASAAAAIGDFLFLAGEPREELAGLRPAGKSFLILVPRHEGWEDCIRRRYKTAARRVTRHAMALPPSFDRARLARAAELPPGYTLRWMDEPLYRWCRGQDWCRDWVAQYPDYAAWQAGGLGAVILREGIPVSGASSYAHCQGGIEIQIDTRPDFRRRGLARACGARLISECLSRGLIPGWDAQNEASAALAEQLGYRYDHPYPAYEVSTG